MTTNQNLPLETIHNMAAAFENTPILNAAQSALLHTRLSDATMRWQAFRDIDHTFSNVVTGEMPITHQKQSGRCWIFAALNLLRIFMGRKYKLEDFEFSQNYLMFFDKLEKSNYFLENIITTGRDPYDSREVMFLVKEPLGDGGQWPMFVNLVKKYGLIPKKCMPDTQQSQNTLLMNQLLTKKLRSNAAVLREKVQQGADLADLKRTKMEMMGVIYNILTACLGTPPSEFDWGFTDKDKKHHCHKGLTPHIFLEKFVPINLDDYVCLINCPMRDTPYNELFTVKFLGNVIEGNPTLYVNLPIDQLKEYAIASLLKDEPLWFGSDVGKSFHRDKGIMNDQLYTQDLFFNTSFAFSKQERLELGESQMTHAMLINGVDLVDQKPKKWRVENSWGKDYGEKGFFIMTDGWFDDHVYEVVVNKKYLHKDILAILKKDPIMLNPWHPMGAVA